VRGRGRGCEDEFERREERRSGEKRSKASGAGQVGSYRRVVALLGRGFRQFVGPGVTRTLATQGVPCERRFRSAATHHPAVYVRVVWGFKPTGGVRKCEQTRWMTLIDHFCLRLGPNYWRYCSLDSTTHTFDQTAVFYTGMLMLLVRDGEDRVDPPLFLHSTEQRSPFNN
jgi:hypothetical protein